MEGSLGFLRKLARNNNREWFEKNRGAYETARGEMMELVETVIKDFGKKDRGIAEQEAKSCLYRINRDVRFSKDKSPYKLHMAASLISGGKKSDLAGYYIHIEPGNSFVGGGKYMTDAPMLKRIRQEIDYNWNEFRSIIKNKKFVSLYGDLDKSPEFSLSREPKGYEKDNPAIEYLKLKSYVGTTDLSDADIAGKDLAKKIVAAFETLQPLVAFLNRALEDE